MFSSEIDQILLNIKRLNFLFISLKDFAKTQGFRLFNAAIKAKRISFKFVIYGKKCKKKF